MLQEERRGVGGGGSESESSKTHERRGTRRGTAASAHKKKKCSSGRPGYELSWLDGGTANERRANDVDVGINDVFRRGKFIRC